MESYMQLCDFRCSLSHDREAACHILCSSSSSGSKFYFQQNTTMEQYQKHFIDISKHVETLLHLPVATRETTGLIKLATY